MTPRPATVHTEMALRLVIPGAASMTVFATLGYDIDDPYAVNVAFRTGTGGAAEVVEWVFARQLLTDGVGGAVGSGDVQVWPATSLEGDEVVCLSLSSPSGRALFELPLPELVEYLAMTYTVVPTGGESELVDVEGELALLLWAEPET